MTQGAAAAATKQPRAQHGGPERAGGDPVSLYGTGRREGCIAAAGVAAFALVAHLLAAAQAGGRDLRAASAALADGAPSALAGVLMYRCLRAHGRSRYAAFLGGAGYALAPWLQAIAALPREQWAAALAPLALEVAHRCHRPDQRRTFLPWAPLLLAAPFVVGPAWLPLLTAGVALVHLAIAARAGDLGERLGLVRRFATAVAMATAVAVAAWCIDAAGPWLAATGTLRPAAVLAAHRTTTAGTDLPALLRLAGPVLLMFAALGVLRRQRHAKLRIWLPVAALGVVPTLLKAGGVLPGHGRWLDLAVVGWWLPLLAVTVLGAAGLDDFLDQPQRRRNALPWLWSSAALGGPLLPLVAIAPDREWPLVAAVLLLALLLPFWRRIGILRFKNTLTTAALLTLLVPALQVLPVVGSNTRAVAAAAVATAAGAAPAGEVDLAATPPANVWRRQYWALASRPLWHYSAFALAGAVAAAGALSAARRNSKAKNTPSKAKAAITKKAKPSARS